MNIDPLGPKTVTTHMPTINFTNNVKGTPH